MSETERADKLRKAIQDYLDGNYASARSYRPGQCPHGVYYYAECEACNDAYFQAALAADDALIAAAERTP